jgi:hypothetical protein
VFGLGQAAESRRHQELQGLALRLLHRCCMRQLKRSTEEALLATDGHELIRVRTQRHIVQITLPSQGDLTPAARQ